MIRCFLYQTVSHVLCWFFPTFTVCVLAGLRAKLPSTGPALWGQDCVEILVHSCVCLQLQHCRIVLAPFCCNLPEESAWRATVTTTATLACLRQRFGRILPRLMVFVALLGRRQERQACWAVSDEGSFQMRLDTRQFWYGALRSEARIHPGLPAWGAASCLVCLSRWWCKHDSFCGGVFFGVKGVWWRCAWYKRCLV